MLNKINFITYLLKGIICSIFNIISECKNVSNPVAKSGEKYFRLEGNRSQWAIKVVGIKEKPSIRRHIIIFLTFHYIPDFRKIFRD